MRRLPINIAPAERVARVAVGLAGVVAGTVLHGSTVYKKLGRPPRSLGSAA